MYSRCLAGKALSPVYWYQSRRMSSHHMEYAGIPFIQPGSAASPQAVSRLCSSNGSRPNRARMASISGWVSPIQTSRSRLIPSHSRFCRQRWQV